MKTKMNICFVYPFYPPENGSYGMGTFVWELAQELIKNKKSKVIIISRTNGDYEDSLIAGIRVVRMPFEQGWGETVINKLTGSQFKMWWYSRRVFKLIEQINSSEKIDVVESCDYGAEPIYFINKRLDYPLIIRCHTPGFLLKKFNQAAAAPPIPGLTFGFEKYLLAQAKRLVFPTVGLEKEVKKSVQINGEVSNQPYVLDCDKIPFKKTYRSREGLKLLVVGRVEKRKGAEETILAIKKLIAHGCKVCLTFIGDETPMEGYGSYTEYLSKKIIGKKTQQYIKFLPGEKREKLLRKYREYDILVMDSVFEGVGYVVLEAMAAGLPVVGSNHGGIAELVKDGVTGYLVEPQNVEKLYEKLKILTLDRGRRQKMGESGRELVNKIFDAKVSAKKIFGYYQRVEKTFRNEDGRR